MSETDRLNLDEAWDETEYERDVYGPDEREGVRAAFERGSMAARVLPVRYECTDGQETFRSLATDERFTRSAPVAFAADVPRRTAFATVVEYRLAERTERRVVCAAHDADDALAVAVWFANGATDDRPMRRNVRLHRGEAARGAGAVVSDDDTLNTLFADAPERCALSGRPTTSHALTLPYRYYPVLDGSVSASRGVPPVPSTVRALSGVASHREWEAHALDGLSFDAALERTSAGQYALDGDVAAVAAEMDASRLALDRL